MFYLKSIRAANMMNAEIVNGLREAFGLAKDFPLEHGSEFTVETEAGTLHGVLFLCSRTSWNPRHWTPAWVHFRFDDVERAMHYAVTSRLNRYSGKWNFHFTADREKANGEDVARMVSEIKMLNPTSFTDETLAMEAYA